MNSRNGNGMVSENSPAAIDVESDVSTDPSERFLARKARWRAKPAPQTDSASGDREYLGRNRGDTSSIAFSPSSYGLK